MTLYTKAEHVKSVQYVYTCYVMGFSSVIDKHTHSVCSGAQNNHDKIPSTLQDWCNSAILMQWKRVSSTLSLILAQFHMCKSGETAHSGKESKNRYLQGNLYLSVGQKTFHDSCFIGWFTIRSLSRVCKYFPFQNSCGNMNVEYSLHKATKMKIWGTKSQYVQFQ